MHDCALEAKSGRGLPSAPRVEHTGHYSEISTKLPLQNHIKKQYSFRYFLNAAATTQCVIDVVST